jgi:NCAIR mutase (PurE)-related protein
MADTGSTFSNMFSESKKAFKELKDLATDFTGAFGTIVTNLDTLSRQSVRTFAQSSEYAEAFRQSFGSALVDITKISENASDIAAVLQQAADIQNSFAKEFNTNIILTSRNLSDFATSAQAFDIPAQSMASIAEGLVTAGQSFNDLPNVLETSANKARAVGVNVSAVFDIVRNNLSDINKFGFENGVEGLARMAISAAGLRVNLNSVFNLADRLFDPEKTIDLVAGFQRLGVAAGDLADPFRLMYLAQNDTEELFKQVTNLTQGFTFFNEETKQFELYPNAKRDLRELESLTQISYNDLVKYSQQTERLRIIGKDLNIGVSDEEKQFITNIATYSQQKGGFEVTLASGKTKLISEIRKEDIDGIKEANKEMSTEEIARAQLNTNKSMAADMAAIRARIAAPIAQDRTISSFAEGLRGGARTLREGVESALPKGQYDEGVKNLFQGSAKVVEDLITGQKKLSDVLQDASVFGGQFTEGFKNMTQNIANFDPAASFRKEITDSNTLIGIGKGLSDALKPAVDEIKSILSVPQTQTIEQNTRVDFNELRVDISGNVNLQGGKSSTEIGDELVRSGTLKTYIEGMIKQQMSQQTPNNFGLLPNFAS